MVCIFAGLKPGRNGVDGKQYGISDPIPKRWYKCYLNLVIKNDILELYTSLLAYVIIKYNISNSVIKIFFTHYALITTSVANLLKSNHSLLNLGNI